MADEHEMVFHGFTLHCSCGDQLAAPDDFGDITPEDGREAFEEHLRVKENECPTCGSEFVLWCECMTDEAIAKRMALPNEVEGGWHYDDAVTR